MSSNKVVLVTGASSGIGLSVARLCAEQGFRVFGTSRKPDGAAASFEMLPLDVRQDDSVRSCVDAVLAKAGRLDVLVNNAGYVLEGAIEEVTLAEAQAQFDTNVFGVIRMVKAVAPIMREQGSGAIVNVSSVAGLVAVPPFCGLYSASKYALESCTEHLWRELKPFNVRVSLVEPGSVRTDLTGNRHAAQSLAPYAEWRRRAIDVLRRREREAPDPSLVARTILSAIRDPSPRLRYAVGREAVWVPRLRKVLPLELFDRMLRRGFGIEVMG